MEKFTMQDIGPEHITGEFERKEFVDLGVRETKSGKKVQLQWDFHQGNIEYKVVGENDEWKNIGKKLDKQEMSQLVVDWLQDN